MQPIPRRAQGAADLDVEIYLLGHISLQCPIADGQGEGQVGAGLRAIPEMARLLRPGGVFAAVDCDWPPCVDAEADAAYGELERRRHALEAARGLRPPRAEKEGHLSRLARSGLFAHTREICLHSHASRDAERRILAPTPWWWTYRVRMAVR